MKNIFPLTAGQNTLLVFFYLLVLKCIFTTQTPEENFLASIFTFSFWKIGTHPTVAEQVKDVGKLH
jgi:hypothetical protein